MSEYTEVDGYKILTSLTVELKRGMLDNMKSISSILDVKDLPIMHVLNVVAYLYKTELVSKTEGELDQICGYIRGSSNAPQQSSDADQTTVD
jgi:hypothetical protein